MHLFLSTISDPQSEISATSGSPLWQIAFISFAVVLILFELVRGCRLGLLRQLMRIVAMLIAYWAAIFGGRLLLPSLRPLVRMPDIFISVLAGALLAFLVYSLITSVGAFLFKRTDQQNSRLSRLFYGLSGGALGVLFGAFLVWILVVGIRAIGSIAEAATRSRVSFATYHDSTQQGYLASPVQRQATNESDSLIISLARLKNSIELGGVGDAIKTTDVVPASTYQTLGKVGQVVSDPESAQRFLSYPGARNLSEHPKIVALRSDREIMEKIAQGRVLELLHNQRLIDAANDPTLVDGIRRFEFQRALDYAVGRN